MKREQLEHIIRASANIADDDEIIVVGSQAVLGQFPAAPAELLVSDEADVYPKNRRVLAITGPGTRGATGWCLEIHDLIVSKLVAGREMTRRWRPSSVPLSSGGSGRSSGARKHLPSSSELHSSQKSGRRQGPTSGF